jgi:hypothetical protein
MGGGDACVALVSFIYTHRWTTRLYHPRLFTPNNPQLTIFDTITIKTMATSETFDTITIKTMATSETSDTNLYQIRCKLLQQLQHLEQTLIYIITRRSRLLCREEPYRVRAGLAPALAVSSPKFALMGLAPALVSPLAPRLIGTHQRFAPCMIQCPVCKDYIWPLP